jgi:hypothetical protein
VEIHWPGNVVEEVKLPGVDRIYTLEQGKGVIAETCAKCAAAHVSSASLVDKAKTAAQK